MAERKSRTWKATGEPVLVGKEPLTKKNLPDYIVSMTGKDVTYDFMMDTFGEFGDTNLAHPYDILEVPAGSFTYTTPDGKEHKNKEKFTTTLGIYVFNLLMEDCKISFLFNGYLNQNVDDDVYGDIEQKLSWAVMEDEISTSVLEKWENTVQWLMPFETVFMPAHTEKMLTVNKVLDKKKAELLKAHAKEIEAGDAKVCEDIEKELLAYAKEYLKDDPAYDTIASGGGGSFGNDFKNMYVMKGAVQNFDPMAKKKYDIVTGSYLNGIPADEYSILAGSGAFGAYYRGKKTEAGGYWEKLFVRAYQHIQLDPRGSDCGTKRHIRVRLTKKNINEYMYSYIIKSNGELELLNSKNRDKYIDKVVNMRFSSMCESKTGLCNKCVGELLYDGAANIGLVITQIPSTLKLRCMKGFHDARVQTVTMDPMKAFFPFDY